MTFKNHLRAIGACQAARKWAENKTAKEAWETCERADWLLWWAAKDGASKQDIVKVVCKIARSVVKLAKTPLAMEAIEAAERWVKESSEENKKKAYEAARAARAAWRADAAYAAYAAAAEAAGVAAAEDAAYAAAAEDAAAAAEDAAYAAEDAAYAAAAEDAAAAAGAARKKQQTKNLAIVRKYLSQPWTETE